MNKNFIAAVIMFHVWICAAVNNSAFAQDQKEIKEFIFVSNDFKNIGAKTIYIKWFAKGIISKEGFNIYRTKATENNWVKLNSEAIKIKQQLPTVLQSDSDAYGMLEAYKKVKEEDVSKLGILHILAITKAVANNDFAEALGIYYTDNTIVLGEKYKYRIMKILAGTEVLAGTSREIKAEAWKKPLPPEDIKLKRTRKAVEFLWKLEPDRYFTLDIFRFKKDKPHKVKVNEGVITVNKKKNGQYPKVFYSDNNLNKDTAYIYQFKTIDHFGNESDYSKELKAGIKDFDPPIAPVNLHYDADILKVKLFWSFTKEPDLAGFNMYRSLFYDSSYVKVNDRLIKKTDSSFIDNVFLPGEYFYKVASVDTGMNETESSITMADVRDVIPPAIPNGLEAKSDTGKIILSWKKNSEPDLKGYYLYRSPVDAMDFVIVNDSAIRATQYIDKLPKNVKTKFAYKVAAQDTSFNRSEPCKPVVVRMPDVTFPAIPSIMQITTSTEGIKLLWIANVDNDLKNYTLYRKGKNGSDTVLIKVNETIPNKDTTFIDAQPPKNNEYIYYLSATDSSNNESYKSLPYTVRYNDFTSKLKIEKFEVNYKKSEKQISIDWKVARGKDFAGCLIYRKTPDKDMEQITGKLTDVETYADKDVKPGKSYVYQMRIYDKLGNILKSKEEEVKVSE